MPGSTNSRCIPAARLLNLTLVTMSLTPHQVIPGFFCPRHEPTHMSLLRFRRELKNMLQLECATGAAMSISFCLFFRTSYLSRPCLTINQPPRFLRRFVGNGKKDRRRYAQYGARWCNFPCRCDDAIMPAPGSQPFGALRSPFILGDFGGLRSM